MKYLIIIILLINPLQEKSIFKEYSGGRQGYSYSKLTLYEDNTYYFFERYDFPGSLKDFGKWKIIGTKLTLISKDSNKMNGNKKLFKKRDSFEVQGNEVHIYSFVDGKKYDRILTEINQVKNK